MSNQHEKQETPSLFKSMKAKLGINNSSSSNSKYARDGKGEDEQARASASINHVSPEKHTLPLSSLPVAAQHAAFLRKLELCSTVYDFSSPSLQAQEKEVKREALQDILDYLNQGSGKLTEEAAPVVVRMISQNLFRELPPSKHSNILSEGTEMDEEEPQLEPAWMHLSLVYELLLRYIVSSDTDAKTAKQYIDHRFILRFLNLFDSEDPRERDYLKTILHRVYGKFMVHRPFIRKSINHVFYRFVYETERHNGIAELLEILGSIINGFALPLKEEHKLFLQRALIPLHKPKCLPMYHQQLAYCVTQFVEKDCTLSPVVIRGLLKYWPVTNSHKEVLFLGELEEILELTHDDEFTTVAEPLLKQLSRCLTSNHFQVGERSLFLWNNEYIVQLLHHNKNVVVPLVVGALEENAKQHWNTAVQNLSGNVRKMFQNMDPKLYERCRKQYEEDLIEKKKADGRRREVFDKLLKDLGEQVQHEDDFKR
jgi:serine/threonine-protein phosphatase 2A regulatory subunit B'